MGKITQSGIIAQFGNRPLLSIGRKSRYPREINTRLVIRYGEFKSQHQYQEYGLESYR